jgi:hypothetical protein
MHQPKTVVIIFLAIFCVLSLTVSGFGQEKDPEAIVREASVDTQRGAIFNYTYHMRFSFERHKKMAGRKFSRLYEAILPSRFALNRNYSHPFVLLQDSERNVTAEEIMNMRKDLAKELERAEKEEETNTKIAETPKDDGGYWTIGFTNEGKRIKIDVLQILKNSRLSNFQRRTVNGRTVVAADFNPNPDFVYEKQLTYLSKIEGQILIDETDKRIVRVEGFALGAFGALREKTDAEREKEAVFLFLQTKVAEGFWFPLTVGLNFGKHPEIFDPIEVTFSFSNYKKSSVDVKDQLDEVKDSPDSSKEAVTKTKDAETKPKDPETKTKDN